MTINVSDNTPRKSYTLNQGASSQSAFEVDFEFFADADLNVYVNDVKKTLTTHYTTSANSGNSASHVSGSVGYIHFTTGNAVDPSSAAQVVVITRSIALDRTTDFPASGAFNIGTLNTELDRLVAIQADINDTSSRGVRLQDSDSAVSMELPLLASRKGTVLGFNATTGAAEAGPSITAVQSLADVTTSINLLGTAAVVEDMGLLATSAVIEDMGLLGTSANVTAMGLLGVSSVITDMGILGTASCVEDMSILGTTANVANMALLATTDIISDLNTLATSAIVEDLNLLATSSVIADMAALAGSGANPNITSLTASGAITGATVEATGDTSAGDNAAIGYTSAEGLILTGQGSTNDVTIKNDADTDVIEIPTGTTNVTIAGNLGVGGTVTGTGTSVFASLDISGDVDVDGTLEADAMTLNGTAITTTATLSTGISNNNVPKFTSGVADNDFLRVDGTAIEGRSASEVLSDIGAVTESTAEANSVALAIALG